MGRDQLAEEIRKNDTRKKSTRSHPADRVVTHVDDNDKIPQNIFDG